MKKSSGHWMRQCCLAVKRKTRLVGKSMDFAVIQYGDARPLRTTVVLEGRGYS